MVCILYFQTGVFIMLIVLQICIL